MRRIVNVDLHVPQRFSLELQDFVSKVSALVARLPDPPSILTPEMTMCIPQEAAADTMLSARPPRLPD